MGLLPSSDGHLRNAWALRRAYLRFAWFALQPTLRALGWALFLLAVLAMIALAILLALQWQGLSVSPS